MAHSNRPSPSDDEPRSGRRDERRRENRGRDDRHSQRPRGFDRNRRSDDDEEDWDEDDETCNDDASEVEDETVDAEIDDLPVRSPHSRGTGDRDDLPSRPARHGDDLADSRQSAAGRGRRSLDDVDETGEVDEPQSEESADSLPTAPVKKRSRMAAARNQFGRAVTGARDMWTRFRTRGKTRETVTEAAAEDAVDDDLSASATRRPTATAVGPTSSPPARTGWARASAAKLGAAVSKVATASRERFARRPGAARGKGPDGNGTEPKTQRAPRRQAQRPAQLVSRSGPVRTLIEFATALLVAVTLFRTFVAEGYWIETGSMATSLLGHHLKAACYACGHQFPTEATGSIEWARCPNCQAGSIKTENLVHGDGDQLLVFRPLFDYVRPERFSVVVFRNPTDPPQAFVKRVVGFPGEELRIERGDLFINGELQRKPILRQRSMRVLVHDQRDQPADSDTDWKPRWVVETPPTASSVGQSTPGGSGAMGWSLTGGVWHYRPEHAGTELAAPTAAAQPDKPAVDAPAAAAASPVDWIAYRHWLRSGGYHATVVEIPGWPAGLDPLTPGIGALSFDSATRRLIVRGVLTEPLRSQLTNATLPVEFRNAVTRLADASHLAPIRDDYSYNRRTDGGGRNEVRDLMLAAGVTFLDAHGVLSFELTDGRERLECRFQAANRTVQLRRVGDSHPLAEAIWPDSLQIGQESEIECSLWDAQFLVAVDGRVVLPPWTYTPAAQGQTAWRPARIGAAGGGIDVAALRLYRDVYYVGGKDLRGTREPIVLGPNEYFMLGDNSPVSRDSRSWSTGSAVTSELFLGKPFVVHLPTQRRPIQIGRWTLNIRIPEISRMRYIR